VTIFLSLQLQNFAVLYITSSTNDNKLACMEASGQHFQVVNCKTSGSIKNDTGIRN